MKILIVVASVLAGVILLLVLGLNIQPASFSSYRGEGQSMDNIPLPDGLPAPVERFFRKVYGDRIPVIESAVVTGRASMRVNGITFPARFRFTHQAGQAYRHYIEATLFGFPIMKVNEHYLDGEGRLELPFGVFESSQVDQAANLGLWAESMWLPGIYLTDPRARWEPIDEESAVLMVPFGEEMQHFMVRFDPNTDLLLMMEAMRYRDAEGGEKILWLSEARSWNSVSGALIPNVGAAIWLDEGSPWAIFTVEEIVYNVDVSDDIRVNGP